MIYLCNIPENLNLKPALPESMEELKERFSTAYEKLPEYLKNEKGLTIIFYDKKGRLSLMNEIDLYTYHNGNWYVLEGAWHSYWARV